MTNTVYSNHLQLFLWVNILQITSNWLRDKLLAHNLFINWELFVLIQMLLVLAISCCFFFFLKSQLPWQQPYLQVIWLLFLLDFKLTCSKLPSMHIWLGTQPKDNKKDKWKTEIERNSFLRKSLWFWALFLGFRMQFPCSIFCCSNDAVISVLVDDLVGSSSESDNVGESLRGSWLLRFYSLSRLFVASKPAKALAGENHNVVSECSEGVDSGCLLFVEDSFHWREEDWWLCINKC